MTHNTPGMPNLPNLPNLPDPGSHDAGRRAKRPADLLQFPCRQLAHRAGPRLAILWGGSVLGAVGLVVMLPHLSTLDLLLACLCYGLVLLTVANLSTRLRFARLISPERAGTMSWASTPLSPFSPRSRSSRPSGERDD